MHAALPDFDWEGLAYFNLLFKFYRGFQNAKSIEESAL